MVYCVDVLERDVPCVLDPVFLSPLYEVLRQGHSSLVFLAGDSTLDNKYWFHDSDAAINGYELILSPANMKLDVNYWINAELVKRGLKNWACINTAVEASSLNSRSCGDLLPQDEFIRDHICEDDVLIVSVGGNDIALNPVLFTILNIIPLVCCTPLCMLEHASCACPPNLQVDMGCCGCGLDGCLAGTLCGFPLGMGYFVNLFKNRVENYIARLVHKCKPRKVLVCMLYYPDQGQPDQKFFTFLSDQFPCLVGRGGWADCALAAMGYNLAPERLRQARQA
jgi:hypothetical protein